MSDLEEGEIDEEVTPPVSQNTSNPLQINTTLSCTPQIKSPSEITNGIMLQPNNQNIESGDDPRDSTPRVKDVGEKKLPVKSSKHVLKNGVKDGGKYGVKDGGKYGGKVESGAGQYRDRYEHENEDDYSRELSKFINDKNRIEKRLIRHEISKKRSRESSRSIDRRDTSRTRSREVSREVVRSIDSRDASRTRSRDASRQKSPPQKRIKRIEDQPHKFPDKPPCRFFAIDKCNKGDQCPYSHEITEDDYCRNYIKTGRCIYKNNCKYLHIKRIIEVEENTRIKKVFGEESNKFKKFEQKSGLLGDHPTCAPPLKYAGQSEDYDSNHEVANSNIRHHYDDDNYYEGKYDQENFDEYYEDYHMNEKDCLRNSENLIKYDEIKGKNKENYNSHSSKNRPGIANMNLTKIKLVNQAIRSKNLFQKKNHNGASALGDEQTRHTNYTRSFDNDRNEQYDTHFDEDMRDNNMRANTMPNKISNIGINDPNFSQNNECTSEDIYIREQYSNQGHIDNYKMSERQNNNNSYKSQKNYLYNGDFNHKEQTNMATNQISDTYSRENGFDHFSQRNFHQNLENEFPNQSSEATNLKSVPYYNSKKSKKLHKGRFSKGLDVDSNVRQPLLNQMEHRPEFMSLSESPRFDEDHHLNERSQSDFLSRMPSSIDQDYRLLQQSKLNNRVAADINFQNREAVIEVRKPPDFQQMDYIPLDSNSNIRPSMNMGSSLEYRSNFQLDQARDIRNRHPKYLNEPRPSGQNVNLQEQESFNHKFRPNPEIPAITPLMNLKMNSGYQKPNEYSQAIPEFGRNDNQNKINPVGPRTGGLLPTPPAAFLEQNIFEGLQEFEGKMYNPVAKINEEDNSSSILKDPRNKNRGSFKSALFSADNQHAIINNKVSSGLDKDVPSETNGNTKDENHSWQKVYIPSFGDGKLQNIANVNTKQEDIVAEKLQSSKISENDDIKRVYIPSFNEKNGDQTMFNRKENVIDDENQDSKTNVYIPSFNGINNGPIMKHNEQLKNNQDITTNFKERAFLDNKEYFEKQAVSASVLYSKNTDDYYNGIKSDNYSVDSSVNFGGVDLQHLPAAQRDLFLNMFNSTSTRFAKPLMNPSLLNYQYQAQNASTSNIENFIASSNPNLTSLPQYQKTFIDTTELGGFKINQNYLAHKPFETGNNNFLSSKNIITVQDKEHNSEATSSKDLQIASANDDESPQSPINQTADFYAPLISFAETGVSLPPHIDPADPKWVSDPRVKFYPSPTFQKPHQSPRRSPDSASTGNNNNNNNATSCREGKLVGCHGNVFGPNAAKTGEPIGDQGDANKSPVDFALKQAFLNKVRNNWKPTNRDPRLKADAKKSALKKVSKNGGKSGGGGVGGETVEGDDFDLYDDFFVDKSDKNCGGKEDGSCTDSKIDCENLNADAGAIYTKNNANNDKNVADEMQKTKDIVSKINFGGKTKDINDENVINKTCSNGNIHNYNVVKSDISNLKENIRNSDSDVSDKRASIGKKNCQFKNQEKSDKILLNQISENLSKLKNSNIAKNGKQKSTEIIDLINDDDVILIDESSIKNKDPPSVDSLASDNNSPVDFCSEDSAEFTLPSEAYRRTYAKLKIKKKKPVEESGSSDGLKRVGGSCGRISKSPLDSQQFNNEEFNFNGRRIESAPKKPKITTPQNDKECEDARQATQNCETRFNPEDLFAPTASYIHPSHSAPSFGNNYRPPPAAATNSIKNIFKQIDPTASPFC